MSNNYEEVHNIENGLESEVDEKNDIVNYFKQTQGKFKSNIKRLNIVNISNKESNSIINNYNSNKKEEKLFLETKNKKEKNFLFVKNKAKNKINDCGCKTFFLETESNKNNKKDIKTINNDLFNPIVKVEKPILDIKKDKRIYSVRNRLITKFDRDLDYFLPKKAIHRPPNPGVIGLVRINHFLPLNVVLQCLSNIPRLRYEFLKKEAFKDLERNKMTNKKLSYAFAEILKNLWKILSQSVYNAYEFLKMIKEINPNILLNNAYNEPKNLIVFLLNELHKELNLPNRNIWQINPNQNIVSNNCNLLSYLHFYQKDFLSRNNSIISNLFNGYLYISERCINCNYYLNKIENFEILDFSIEKIRYLKNSKNNYININECFEYYQKENIFNLCNNCGNQINNQVKLLNLPQILIINFSYQQNFQTNTHIIYEDILNLKNYIIFNNISPYLYELIGIICVLNSDENNNNFISFCKNSNKCFWYKYDNEKVTKYTFNQIISGEYKIYTLFYSFIQN